MKPQTTPNNDIRQPAKALEDAEEHLGHAINALQDAGWTNEEITAIEKTMAKVSSQK